MNSHSYNGQCPTHQQEKESTMDTGLLEAQAYTNAVSRLNVGPGYGYGYGHGSREAYDGTVTAAQNHQILRGQDAITDRIAESGQNTLNIIQNNALTGQLNGFRDFVTASFNAQDRAMSNLALQTQECCCETKAAIAALDAKVECNEKVRQAEIAARTNVLVEQLSQG